MKLAAAIVVFMLLSPGVVFACTTEESMTASLQANDASVQVEQRYKAFDAQKFLALFARFAEVGEPPPVELVVIYSKPGASTHKIVGFFNGCMLGHGYITLETYTAILGKLRLAMSL